MIYNIGGKLQWTVDNTGSILAGGCIRSYPSISSQQDVILLSQVFLNMDLKSGQQLQRCSFSESTILSEIISDSRSYSHLNLFIISCPPIHPLVLVLSILSSLSFPVLPSILWSLFSPSYPLYHFLSSHPSSGPCSLHLILSIISCPPIHPLVLVLSILSSLSFPVLPSILWSLFSPSYPLYHFLSSHPSSGPCSLHLIRRKFKYTFEGNRDQICIKPWAMTTRAVKWNPTVDILWAARSFRYPRYFVDRITNHSIVIDKAVSVRVRKQRET